MLILENITQAEINQTLAEAACSRIVDKLTNSRPGHCQRVSTLPEAVMRQLCSELNETQTRSDIVFLLGPRQKATEYWQVSATRLIELRNEGKRPLLVFIPPGLKAAAEDSFDISTFAEVELGDIPSKVRAKLRDQLPEEQQRLIDVLFQELRVDEYQLNDEDIVRYYLTIIKNGMTDEAAGGAVYQLGLIPNFSLFSNPDKIAIQVDRNLYSLQTLLNSKDSLLACIHNLHLEENSLQADLYRFLRSQPLQDVKHWASIIATDAKYRPLALDCWPFVGEGQRDKVLLFIDDLGLAPRDSTKPIGPNNPPYLDVNQAKTLRVKWETNPRPGVIRDLEYFRIEIISAEDGLTAWQSKNIPTGTAVSSARTKAIKVSDFRDHVEDKLYFLRVRAYTSSGECINEEDAEANSVILRDPRNPEGKKINESEDVWFWKDQTSPPPVDPLRSVTVNSFLDAQLHVYFNTLDQGENPYRSATEPRQDKTGWAADKGARAESIYNIIYDAQTRFSLPVSNTLRKIESDTLARPEHLGRWYLNFEGSTNVSNITPSVRPFRNTSQVPANFLQARSALFQAIQNGEKDELIETVDLLKYKEQILEYVEAYEEWLLQATAEFENSDQRRTDAVFFDIDTVEIKIPSDIGRFDRLYLIAPTHPLRLLWHLQRGQLAHDWLSKALSTSQPKKTMTPLLRKFLRQGLAPMNIPPILRFSHEGSESITHFYIEQAPLTPFWSLYVREDVQDRRALQSRAKRFLGIGRSSIESGAVGGIDKQDLVQKVERYLLQHPYVSTLKVNVFNPGDADLLVESILIVEKNRNKAALDGLRYELRLFTQDTILEDVGASVEDLLNPERQVSPEADAFSTPGQNPLFPKLRFYRNQQEDFLLHPEIYEAHLSILHDVFPTEVDLELIRDGRSSFVHGLIQDQVTLFEGNQVDYAWERQLHPTGCKELPNDTAEVSVRMANILSRISTLQASLAAGKKVENSQPTVHLKLALKDKNLLYQVHEVSDWVLIIDRNLGLEYFDGTPTEGRPIYLLDYVPEFGDVDTDRLLLTTRITDEITTLIRPVLDDRDLRLGDQVELYFLTLLRSLSGRLALKLLSAPNQVSEVLGLAMARLFLEKFDLLDNRILIPLDAHGNLFTEAGRNTTPADEISFQRSDLLLVDCDIESRRLTFHIIEVKWRTDLGDLNAYLTLKQQVESQLNQSENTLREHFDPNFTSIDRLDRAVKVRELVSLLNFYLERSLRYGLIDRDAAGLLKPFIESLDQGYSVETSKIGLIFDFGSMGLTTDEEYASLVFYRIGKDYIHRLLESGLRVYTKLQIPVDKAGSIVEQQQQQEEQEKIKQETGMSTDVHYPTVQTHFRPPSKLPTSTSGVTTQKPGDEKETPARPNFVESSIPPISKVEPVEIPTDTHPPEGAKLAFEDEVETTEPLKPSNTFENTVSPSYDPPSYDVLIGDTTRTKQYGIIGKSSGQMLALDLNGTNTISLFGVQGGGKSYTVGSIVEMATQPIEGINSLPSPLASVIFHYHESQDYPPEFVSMNRPNSNESEVKALKQEYGAEPTRLEDVLILTSADKLPQRRIEFPSVQVEPIYFSSTELSIKDWRFLMGVGGNQMYMKQINMIMRQLREQMTLQTLREQIQESDLSDSQKNIASIRLDFASQFINDQVNLAEKLQPGRLIIVDLRDEFIDKEEALGLFVVMLNIFANAGREAGFNKLIVFDEAHKYMDNPDLTSHIVDVIRQMRHQGVSVLIASQDPPSLPNAIIELSTLIILHRFNSPQWLRHVQRSITALADLTPAQMASLGPGEAFIWTTKATERIFNQRPVRVRMRPRTTQHGGGTKTAV